MASTEELIGVMRELETSVNNLAKRSDYQQGVINQTVLKTKNIMKFVVAGLVLALSLLVAGGILIDQGGDRDREIAQIQERTGNDVLCPLYAVFIKSLDAPPPPNQTAEQLENRRAADKIIRDGYGILECH